MTMMKFIVRRPRDDVNERTVAEDKIEMTAAESHGDAAGESQPHPRAEMVDPVSYTHLPLPTSDLV